MKTGLVITHLSEHYIPNKLGKSSVERLSCVFDTIELSNLLSEDFEFSGDDFVFNRRGAYYSARVCNLLRERTAKKGYINHDGKVFFSIGGELNSEALMSVNDYERLVLTGAYVGYCHLLTFRQLRAYLPRVKEFVMVGDSMFDISAMVPDDNNHSLSDFSSDEVIDVFKGYYAGSNSFLINEPFTVDINNKLTCLGVNIKGRRYWRQLSIDDLMKNKLGISKYSVRASNLDSKPDGLVIKYFKSALEALDYLS